MVDPPVTHFRRACAYLDDAKKTVSAKDKARYLGSAVTETVAVVESFLGQVQDRERLRELAWQVPRYRLLKRVRIHEFHRRPLPVIPSQRQGRVRMDMMLGPVTFSAGGEGPGSAGMIGRRFFTSGSGKIDRTGGAGSEKELWICDGKLFDEFVNDYVSLESALSQCLDGMPDFIRAASLLA